MALLEVRGLRTGYEGIPVVFGVDLDVEEGEVVALLGANGAGKTTTLRAISGMIPVMAGSITFEGVSLAGRPAERIARSGLLHVPAGRGVFPSLAVAETLRMAAANHRLSAADASQRLDEVYATFPRLSERANQTAGTLSGGEQQMLALARGLMVRPRLLMIDEMSQGLAPTIVSDLFAILSRFTEFGTSVLLVEQFVGQALNASSRAYVLEKGEVSFAGEASVLAQDASFVAGSYLGGADAEPIRVEPGAGAGSRRSVLAEHLGVSLPPALMRGLQDRARREGREVAELVQEAVEAAASTGTAPPSSRGGADGRAQAGRKVPAGRTSKRAPGRKTSRGT